ncbi:MAG TPA: hypothetical protein VIX82_19830, partial [Solirubrobacteraceae bacterium]
GELIVGLRPEALQPAMNGLPSIEFQVDVVEPLGDEVIVHGSVAAELARVPDEVEQAALPGANGLRTEAIARLSPRDRPTEGTTIRLAVEPTEVYLFDAATGIAIR